MVPEVFPFHNILTSTKSSGDMTKLRTISKSKKGTIHGNSCHNVHKAPFLCTILSPFSKINPILMQIYNFASAQYPNETFCKQLPMQGRLNPFHSLHSISCSVSASPQANSIVTRCPKHLSWDETGEAKIAERNLQNNMEESMKSPCPPTFPPCSRP